MPTAKRRGEANRLPETPTEKQTLQQLRQDTEALHELRETQGGVLEDLRRALANGEITQRQYNDAVGIAFDQLLATFQSQLVAEGQPEKAAAVPVGIGVSRQAAPAEAIAAVNPFAPPEGVQFTQAAPSRPGKLSDDEAFLASPAAPRPLRELNARVPDEVFDAIPWLVRAAADPDAPPAVQALLRLLEYHING